MVRRLVCSECPIREACLEYALERAERWGIWGGATPREREQLMRERVPGWKWPAQASLDVNDMPNNFCLNGHDLDRLPETGRENYRDCSLCRNMDSQRVTRRRKADGNNAA